MRHTPLLTAAAIACATAMAIAQQPTTTSLATSIGESPAVALKTAMNRALVDGDVAATVLTYRDIATRYRTSAPDVAAQALVLLATTYERLGKPEARATYEEILRDFPDQKDAATAARAKIAAQPEIVVQRLWRGDDVDLFSKPSRDGKFLAYVDWTSSTAGNVAVRDLNTGTNRLLTHATSENDHADEATPSPDGRQIAFEWNDSEIRLINFDGSRLRTLVDHPGYAHSLHWSPDGRSLAASIRGNGDNQIVIISVADGSMKRLKSTGWREASVGGFSPDGRYLVFSIDDSPNADDGGVFTIGVDGSRETALVQGPNDDTDPAWAPDGRTVVFLSNRSATEALWAIQVNDGKPSGAPTLLRSNVERSIGFTADGSYYYAVNLTQRDVYVATIDPETLAIQGSPSGLTERFVGRNTQAAWSPDGRSVVFVQSDEGGGTGPTLVVRSIQDGAERALAKNVGASPQWFPDSRSILTVERDYIKRRSIIRRVDVATGAATTIFEPSLEVYPTLRLSTDGQSIYYSLRERATEDEGILHLVKRELTTGRETDLYRTAAGGVGFFGMALSPDGRRLSFAVNVAASERETNPAPRALRTISTDGGQARELYRGAFSCPQPNGGAWTKDSRFVLALCEDGNRRRLVAFPAEGGEPRKLDLSMAAVADLALSGDGKHLAFTGSQNRDKEIWMIKNLLAGAPRAAN